MHVLFVEPAFPKNQREFPRALHSIGAKVTAIGEAPPAALGSVKQYLHGYEQVSSVTNEGALEEAVRRVQGREWVHRLESTVEAHTMAVAHVRERTGIPGTSGKTAWLCRDKPSMKAVLRDADIPTAMSTGAESAEDARQFAAEQGYPLVLKPRDAAGAAGTYRVDSDEELEQAIQACQLDRGMPTAIEEFVEGHEGFYDTLTVGGHVVHEFVCHYYPNVLEAMRTRWINPQIVLTNRNDEEGYDEVRAMGKRVIETFEIGTSATHMEWFFGPKGLKFSEIGCRPPGVCVWDIYSAANEMDLYVEWAKAICGAEDFAQASRRYAGGMIALRPEGDGTITGYEGREIVDQLGDAIIDAHFPAPGTPTQGVDAGYMANAWVRVRHPDFDELKRLLDKVGETVKTHVR